jgi:hypothetical protein
VIDLNIHIEHWTFNMNKQVDAQMNGQPQWISRLMKYYLWHKNYMLQPLSLWK